MIVWILFSFFFVRFIRFVFIGGISFIVFHVATTAFALQQPENIMNCEFGFVQINRKRFITRKTELNGLCACLWIYIDAQTHLQSLIMIGGHMRRDGVGAITRKCSCKMRRTKQIRKRVFDCIRTWLHGDRSVQHSNDHNRTLHTSLLICSV